MKKSIFSYKTLIHIFFVIYALLCILPFLLVISISISNETDVVNNGFKLIPEHIDLSAYKQIFKNPDTLVDAYGITLLSAFGGTTLAILSTSMMGYALSRDTPLKV